MAAGGKSGDAKRAERLKAALRDNLKRRKAQARGRSKETGPKTSAAHSRDPSPPRGFDGLEPEPAEARSAKAGSGNPGPRARG
jgi:hypothetical protein